MKRTIGGFLITTTRFEEINVTRKILNEKSLVYEEYGEEKLDQEFSFEIMSDMTLDQIKELFDRIENEVKSKITKTKEEIKKYVKSQSWCCDFEIELFEDSRQSLDEYIDNLKSKDRLITGAFCHESPQGWCFWDKVNSKYLEWLHS